MRFVGLCCGGREETYLCGEGAVGQGQGREGNEDDGGTHFECVLGVLIIVKRRKRWMGMECGKRETIRGEEEKASEDKNLLCVGISWYPGNQRGDCVLYLLRQRHPPGILWLYIGYGSGSGDQFQCGLAWLWICSPVLFRFALGSHRLAAVLHCCVSWRESGLVKWEAETACL